MKRDFKNVALPGQKCRKVAEIKQPGHRTAILKRYETPDKNLTVRFFCNIRFAFHSPQARMHASGHSLIKSSLKLKLQKAALRNHERAARSLVKPVYYHAAGYASKQVRTVGETVHKSALKSKTQIKWLSI